MRISDWSSDVCSSDRCHKGEFAPAMRRELDPEPDRTNRIKRPSQRSAERLPFHPGRPGGAAVAAEESPAIGFHAKAREAIVIADHPMEHDGRFLGGIPGAPGEQQPKSEEHTSELQSLMRI